MNKTPVIHCENLSKTYRDADLIVNVFNNIQLTVMPGETVAIIGSSGAGKSTLLQLLGGLDKPSSGVVSVCGKKIADITERQRCELRNTHLGFIYQFHHLLPEFSAIENVAMPLLIAGVSKKIIQEKSEKLLAQVGLKNRMNHRVSELSGGERQRIAIARALVNNPACVLADEPTGNLDHSTADIVFDLMLDLNREHQTSFVIVTHNEALAKRCGRVLELKNGGLV